MGNTLEDHHTMVPPQRCLIQANVSFKDHGSTVVKMLISWPIFMAHENFMKMKFSFRIETKVKLELASKVDPV